MGEQLLCDMQVVLKAINESGGQDFAARAAWVDMLVERYGERPIKPGWQSLAAGLRWLNSEGKVPPWFKFHGTPARALLVAAREWAKPEYDNLRTP